jgi:hypothetical protein
MRVFDNDVFVADCLAAVRLGGGQKAVNNMRRCLWLLVAGLVDE